MRLGLEPVMAGVSAEKTLSKRGRNVGKHAQTIAMQVSTMDHIAVKASFPALPVSLELTQRVWMVLLTGRV